MSFVSELTKGIIKENPIFVIVLGMCPTLATSTSVENALGMGFAATFVLVCSNIFISLIKNITPDKIRIPVYVVVIASFVSIVDMSMAAYVPALHKSLGIFIPLIVVNCIILGRAEAFANKNSVLNSIADGIGMGAGFTLALTVVATFREILGNGTWLNFKVMPTTYEPMLITLLAPGAFITLGLLMAVMNVL
ncbi:MAG: electron transport complex subunit E, partial [Candidatus Cloacimonas sp.]|nr:electron transport complex subunit E [Candidatus Cloacimonas sp.]